MKVPPAWRQGLRNSLQIQRKRGNVYGKERRKIKKSIRTKVDSSFKCAFQFESGKTMGIFTLWTLLRFRNYLRCLELHFRPAKDPFALFFSFLFFFFCFLLTFSTCFPSLFLFYFFGLQRPLAINHGAEKGKFYMKTRLGLSSTRLCGMWQVESGKWKVGKWQAKQQVCFHLCVQIIHKPLAALLLTWGK